MCDRLTRTRRSFGQTWRGSASSATALCTVLVSRCWAGRSMVRTESAIADGDALFNSIRQARQEDIVGMRGRSDLQQGKQAVVRHHNFDDEEIKSFCY
ncbi:short-chain dehydrogenase/reductase (plasmid) [Rhizobium tropici CIAT 899]|nr:short-chain dehydrogenase/reductase [Rhizobium tropici CIAT 899]